MKKICLYSFILLAVSLGLIQGTHLLINHFLTQYIETLIQQSQTGPVQISYHQIVPEQGCFLCSGVHIIGADIHLGTPFQKEALNLGNVHIQVTSLFPPMVHIQNEAVDTSHNYIQGQITASRHTATLQNARIQLGHFKAAGSGVYNILNQTGQFQAITWQLKHIIRPYLPTHLRVFADFLCAGEQQQIQGRIQEGVLYIQDIPLISLQNINKP